MLAALPISAGRAQSAPSLISPLPSLRGCSTKIATQFLEENGALAKDGTRGIVVLTDPPAGSAVRPKDVVGLLDADTPGPPGPCILRTVPEVRGKTVADAKRLLKERDLGAVLTPDVTAGVVRLQDPTPGRLAPAGWSVALQSEPPTPTPRPTTPARATTVPSPGPSATATPPPDPNIWERLTDNADNIIAALIVLAAVAAGAYWVLKRAPPVPKDSPDRPPGRPVVLTHPGTTQSSIDPPGGQHFSVTVTSGLFERPTYD